MLDVDEDLEGATHPVNSRSTFTFVVDGLSVSSWPMRFFNRHMTQKHSQYDKLSKKKESLPIGCIKQHTYAR